MGCGAEVLSRVAHTHSLDPVSHRGGYLCGERMDHLLVGGRPTAMRDSLERHDIFG